VRLAALLLIVLAGLALRLDHAWTGAEENLPDSAAYERLARGLAETGEFEQVGPDLPRWTQPATNYSPGLPLLAGGIFVVSGSEDGRVVRIVLALMGSLAIPVTFLIGRRLLDYWAGLAGAAIVAFYPTLITDSGMVLSEGLAGLLIGLALLTLFRAADGGRSLASWILPGLFFGLGAMVRPEFLAVCIVLAVIAAFFLRPDGIKAALGGPAVLLLTALVVISPWTIRNALELERFVPISTGGGQALFTGSYLPTDGNPQKLVPELFIQYPELRSEPLLRDFPPPSTEEPPADQALAALAAMKAPGVASEATLSRLGREQYLDTLSGDPLRLAGFMAQKTYHVWLRGRANLTSSLGGQLLHWSILAFALVGLWRVWRTRPFEFRIIVGTLLTVTAIGLLLVASPRRVLSIWPVVASLSGTGVALTGSVLDAAIRGRSGTLPVP